MVELSVSYDVESRLHDVIPTRVFFYEIITEFNKIKSYNFMTEIFTVLIPYIIGFTLAWFFQRNFYTNKIKKLTSQ